MAAMRGQIVCWMSLVSTVSPHMQPPPEEQKFGEEGGGCVVTGGRETSDTRDEEIGQGEGHGQITCVP